MDIHNNKLIFVTGASRSGTTMLCRIFGRHSNIFSLNELHVFGDLIPADKMLEVISNEKQIELARKIIQRQRFGIFHADKKLEKDDLLESIIEQLPTSCATAADVFNLTVHCLALEGEKSIACEQTPRNIFYAKQLLDAYPHAHVVHMVRDPRSVLASQKAKWRRKFLGGKQIPWLEVIRMWCNYHPITLSKLWVVANRNAKLLETLPHFHLVKFEALIDDPKQTLFKLCQSMQIGYEDEMLNITHVGSSHQQNSNEVQGISKSTTNTWKEGLNRAEVHISQQVCKTLMSDFGYKLTTTSPSLFDLIVVWCRFPLHLAGVALFNTRRAKIQLLSILNKLRT